MTSNQKEKTTYPILKAVIMYAASVIGLFLIINIIIPLVSVLFVALAFGK